MRILYFHFYYSTKQGSTGTRSYHMAKALAKRGHHVTIACASWSQSETGLTGDVVNGMRRGRVEDFDVIEFVIPYDQSYGPAQRLKSWLKFAQATIRLARQNDFDLLFSTSTPLTVAIPGIMTTRSRKGRPFVLEVRDLWPELPKALGYSNPLGLFGMHKLERAAYRAADAGVGLSPGIVDGMNRGGMAGKPMAMIPNGCDLEAFKPVVGKKCFELPGVERGDFVAVFTGTHGRANGLNAVLDAAAELQRRGETGIKLVLIGKGGEKADLVARAQREGLSNCVFHEPMPKVELARLCAHADVGLMCLANVEGFYYGTSPNKFFDYLASGIPILVNYPGWMADMVRDHQLGAAVPPNDARAFADALCALRQDPARAVYGQNARSLGEREFDWNKLGDQMADHLEAVAARATRPL